MRRVLSLLLAVAGVQGVAEDAQWAGVGLEGTVLALDNLSIEPSGHRLNLTVTSSGGRVSAGDVLVYGDVDQSSLEFTLSPDDPSWTALDKFTLVLLDLDNLTPSTPFEDAYVHGVWSNLSPGAVATPLNADVINWSDLAPAFGPHRFLAILFEQVGGALDADYVRRVMGYADGTADPVNRAFFNTTGFRHQCNLAVSDATFFYMPCNAASAAASIVPGLSQCTQYCSGACTIIQEAEGSKPALTACPCANLGTMALNTALPDTVTDAQWGGVGPDSLYGALDFIGTSPFFKAGATQTVRAQAAGCSLPYLSFCVAVEGVGLHGSCE